MKLSLAQLIVTTDITVNTSKILSVLDRADIDEWVVFPEGMISGYYPEDPDYIRHIDKEALFSAISTIQYSAMARKCHCVIGTALPGQPPRNVALHINRFEQAYTKIQLDDFDRRHFAAGTELPVFDGKHGRFGVQIGQELLYGEQWQALKQGGAAVIYHLNNGADLRWRHVLIARALENGVYVVSANNAAAPQLASYIIAPTGEVLLEAPPGEERLLTTRIDLR